MAAAKSNYNTRGSKRRQRTASVSKEKTTTSSRPVKKRKISIPIEDYDNRVLMNRKNSDMFCWKCHTYCVDQYCTSCPKVFHSDCLTRTYHFNNKGECHSCHLLSNKDSSATDVQLSDILALVVKSSMKETNCCIENPKMAHIIQWKSDSKIDEKLFYKKDMRDIVDNCVQEDLQYDSHLELLDDVRWIYHNCCIKYGENNTKATSAKKVLDRISIELDDALDCPECYCKKKADEPVFFLQICKKPHPLVWAKLKGFPYWPAKCLAVQNKKAHVRFFHTHQIGRVPITSCLFLSKDYPINTRTIKKPNNKVAKTDDLKRAQLELDEYINVFVEKYGEFPYEPVNTPFEFEKGEAVIKELVDEFEKHKSRRIYKTSSTIQIQPIQQQAIRKEPSTHDASSNCEFIDLTDVDENEDTNIETESVDINVEETDEETNSETRYVEIEITEDEVSSENRITRAEQMPEPEQNQADARIESGVTDNSYPSIADIQDANPAYCIDPPISPSSTGISISNIFSADIRADTSVINPTLIENDVIATAQPLQGVSSNPLLEECFSQVISGNVRNIRQSVNQDDDIEFVGEFSSPSLIKDKISENDVRNVIQAITRVDPRANHLIKYVNSIIQRFFIQFWGTASTVVNPETIISKQENELDHQKLQGIQQENEIRNLKCQIDELIKETGVLRKTYEAKVKNSEWLWKGIKAEKARTLESMKKEYNLKIEELKERFEENLKKAKNWCSKTDCNKIAVQICCHDGQNIVKYCSKDCLIADKEHHLHCKRQCSSSVTPETDDDSHKESAVITFHEQMKQAEMNEAEATSSSTEIEKEANQETMEELSNESEEVDANIASPSSSQPDSSSSLIDKEKEPKQNQAPLSLLFEATRKLKSESDKKSRHTKNPHSHGHLF